MDRRYAACSPAEHRARVVRGVLAFVLATVASTAAAVATTLAPAGYRAPAAPADPAAHAARLLASAAGGTWEEVADTGSMSPALTSRQFAVLTPVDIRAVRTRDIVVFRARLPHDPPGSAPRRVVHRVVAVQGCDGVPAHARSRDCVVLRVQGDANARPDVVPVTSANFEGRIAWIVDRVDGRVRDVVADPAGRTVQLEAALASLRPSRRASQPSGTSLSAYTFAIR
jgi:hypothetical protein